MTGKEPTQKQIKEFWEYFRFNWDGNCWSLPIEYGSFSPSYNPPELDLNNLFKYAVPKLDYAEINRDYRQSSETGYILTHSDFIYTAIVALDISHEKTSIVENKDAALALFWAIYEIVKLP